MCWCCIEQVYQAKKKSRSQDGQFEKYEIIVILVT